MMARGTWPLLAVAAAAAFLAAVAAGLAAACGIAVTAYDRLSRSWPAQRLLWVLPLADLAAAFVLLFAPLAIPSWRGEHDHWKDLLGLPPAPFTRLVMTAFVTIGFQVVYLFLVLARRTIAGWARAPARTVPADAVTTLAVAAGLAILAALIVHWQLALPHNMAYLRGWVALGLGNRPSDAAAHFTRVVASYPDSDLADACLYRLAHIEADELGQPARAADHLERLLERYPRSPYIDDALFELGEMALAPPAPHPARAESRFRAVLERFPRSYLRERSLLGLARALLAAGRHVEGGRALDELLAGPSRPRIVTDPPGERVRVTGLAEAVAAVRAGAAPGR
jgi:tetratricopeptide (TPR) repeat protein